MIDPVHRQPVADLVAAVRRQPTVLPVGELLALHATGGDVSIDLTGATPIAYLQPPGPAVDGRFAGLSRREVEVAELAAEGLSNRQIARALSISLHTVKDHMHAVLAKSGFTLPQPGGGGLAPVTTTGPIPTSLTRPGRGAGPPAATAGDGQRPVVQRGVTIRTSGWPASNGPAVAM